MLMIRPWPLREHRPAEHLTAAQRAGQVGVEDAVPLGLADVERRPRAGVRPAQLTRMSTRPNPASTASRSASSDARSATSDWTRSVRRPARLDLGGGGREVVRAARRGDHVGAGLGQAERDRPGRSPTFRR